MKLIALSLLITSDDILYHPVFHHLYFTMYTQRDTMHFYSYSTFEYIDQCYTYYTCLQHLHSKYIIEKYITINFFICTIIIMVNNRKSHDRCNHKDL